MHIIIVLEYYLGLNNVQAAVLVKKYINWMCYEICKDLLILHQAQN